MKIKNLTFVDLYLHKIVLGVAVLFILLVTVFYVINQPYSVQVSGQDMKPSEVEEQLTNAAKSLDTKITSKTNPLPEMPVLPYTEQFQQRARRALASKSQLDVPIGQPGLDPKDFPVEAPPTLIYVAAPPPPATDLKARADFGVLAMPEAKEEAESWTRLVGNQEPRDVRIVTVTGVFDMGEWRRRLQEVPEVNRVPETWWRSRPYITDVILERQTLDPATGQWGKTERLAPLPNATIDLRKFAGNFPDPDPSEVLSRIATEQEIIRQPPPPPLTADRPWVPPGTEVKLTDEQQKRLAVLNDEIQQLQSRLSRSAAGAAAQQERQDRRDERERGPAPNAPRPGGGAERPGGPGPTRDAASPRPQPVRPQNTPGGRAPAADAGGDRGKLQEQLQVKLAERAALVRGEAAQPHDIQVRGPEEVAPSDRLEVWAHDVTAKPGTTYRYRILVAVVNPLFQRQELGQEQMGEHFTRLALVTDPSEEKGAYADAWTEPVKLEEESYFFLVGGNAGAQNVTVEVWRIMNGAFVPREFVVQPGDPIGRAVSVPVPGGSKQVDMSVGAVAVDIDFQATVANNPMSPSTTRMIYLNQNTGKLEARTVLADRDDPMRTRLRSQAGVAVAEGR